MKSVRCTQETRELQDILEHNFDLLPGDQIDPDAPCRWMLIKREMPVPDSSTGMNRWNIDFFFVDQSAMPTFVECKIFSDTRSRREVVGQMLEYAANGPYLWSKETILTYAQETAKDRGEALDDAVRTVQQGNSESTDAFFDRVSANLEQGQVRLVFFLEEAPNELKAIVEFLNKQMESSEVLLVEARQYERDGMRVIVPSLFGFTEQARRVKKTVTVTSRETRPWDWNRFEADARGKGLADAELGSIKNLLLAFESFTPKPQIEWGSGKLTGSFSMKWPAITSGAILSVYSTGDLAVAFGNLQRSELARSFRDSLKEMIAHRVGLPVPANPFPQYKISKWGPKVELLIEGLKELAAYVPATQSAEA
jgi:hypothetical protein